MSAAPSEARRKDPATTMISVSNITKRFGSVVALDSVALSITKGERVAFVGANGSGKTTLIRALLGLVRVEGRILIDGIDVAAEPEIALRSVAYIPQIAPPVEASAAEIVRATAAIRGGSVERVWDRASALGLDPSAARTKRFRDLSGGMKQKLLAAMALAAETPILICDEPTANLDRAARTAFFEQLASRPKSSIVILSSHRIDEVRQIVDRVVELSEGRVSRDAPITELFRDLRAFRVELTLPAANRRALDLVRARGFKSSGTDRFVAEVTQEEKVALVTQLLGELGDDLVDLSVAPIEDINAAIADAVRREPPKLKVVK